MKKFLAFVLILLFGAAIPLHAQVSQVEVTRWSDLQLITNYAQFNPATDPLLFADASDTTTEFPGGVDKRATFNVMLDSNKIFRDLRGITTPTANKLLGYDQATGAYNSVTVGSGLTYTAATRTLSATATGGDGSGEANTASNVGTAGTGLFYLKSGVDLQFYKLNSAYSDFVTVTLDAANLKIDLNAGTKAVTTDNIATLTNKTIAAGSNTITGIADANIAAGANIDAAKLGTGAVSTTVFNHLVGTTSGLQGQLNLKYDEVAATTGNFPAFASSGATLVDSGLKKNDSGTSTNDLWSGSKITASLAGKLSTNASSTDNALVRWDGSGGTAVQGSGAVLSDTNVLTGLAGLTSSGTITLSGLASGFVKSTAGVLSGGNTVDISADTNLSATSPLVLTGDVLSIGDATTAAKGAASFSSSNFGVTAGAVSIKSGGVTTAEILDGTILVGDLAPSLSNLIGNATKIRGITVTTESPSDNKVLKYDAATSTIYWENDVTGGAGSSLTVKVDTVALTDADVAFMNFDSDGLTVTESPDTEVNVALTLGTYANGASLLGAAYIGAGEVSNTEWSYLDGVTSAIQPQIDGKAPTSHNHNASAINAGRLDSIDRLPTLNSTLLWLGDGTNVPAAVTLSGHATIANTGAVTVRALTNGTDYTAMTGTVGYVYIDTNGPSADLVTPTFVVHDGTNPHFGLFFSTLPVAADDAKFVKYDAAANAFTFDSAGAGAGDMTKAAYDADTDNDIDLAAGGTGAALSDPAADAFFMWDDVAGASILATFSADDFVLTTATSVVSLSAKIPKLDAAAAVSGVWEVQDDTLLNFGNDADFGLRFVSVSSRLELGNASTYTSAAGLNAIAFLGTANSTAANSLKLYEDSDNGSNYIIHKAAESVGNNLTIVWGGAAVAVPTGANAVPIFDATMNQTDNIVIDGDGLTIDTRALKVNLSATGGLETDTGALKVKLEDTTLALSGSGLKVVPGNISINDLADILTQAKGGWGADVSAFDGIVTASSGTFSTVASLTHELGGLEADVSAYAGLVAISGGATSQVTTKAGLEAILSDVTTIYADAVEIPDGNLSANVVLADGAFNISGTWEVQDNISLVFGNDADAAIKWISATGRLQLGNANVYLDSSNILHVGGIDIPANSTAGQAVTLFEDSDNGTNYVKLKAKDAIATNETIELDGGAGAAAANSIMIFGASAADVTSQTGWIQSDGIGLEVASGALRIAASENVTDLTGNWATTGALTGGALTSLKSTNYTIGTDTGAELYGGIIYVTGNCTLTLPAVTARTNVTVRVRGAYTVSVDSTSPNQFVLNGTAITAGYKVTSNGTSGATASFVYGGASNLVEVFDDGKWSNGGA